MFSILQPTPDLRVARHGHPCIVPLSITIEISAAYLARPSPFLLPIRQRSLSTSKRDCDIIRHESLGATESALCWTRLFFSLLTPLTLDTNAPTPRLKFNGHSIPVQSQLDFTVFLRLLIAQKPLQRGNRTRYPQPCLIGQRKLHTSDFHPK